MVSSLVPAPAPYYFSSGFCSFTRWLVGSLSLSFWSVPVFFPSPLTLRSLFSIHFHLLIFAFEFHAFVFNMHFGGTFSLVVIDVDVVVDVDVVIVVNVVVIVIIIVVLHRCCCCRPSNSIIIMITIIFCCYCHLCISESQYWCSSIFSPFFYAFTTSRILLFTSLSSPHSLYQMF